MKINNEEFETMEVISNDSDETILIEDEIAEINAEVDLDLDDEIEEELSSDGVLKFGKQKDHKNVLYSALSTVVFSFLLFLFVEFYTKLIFRPYLTIGVAVGLILYYFITQDDIDSVSEKLGFFYFKAAAVSLIFTLVNSLCYQYLFLPVVGKFGVGPAKIAIILAGIFNVAVMVVLMQYFKIKYNAKKLDSLRRFSAKGLFNARKIKKSEKQRAKDFNRKIKEAGKNKDYRKKQELEIAKTLREMPDIQICVDKKGKPIIIPYNDRYLHMKIIGPTGSGKTSMAILPMIRQDLMRNDIGITIIEPKGDLAIQVAAMAKSYKKKCIYFDPTLPDCPFFNPLVGRESTVVENMAKTFRLLAGGGSSNQYFLDMGEDLIKKSIKLIKRYFREYATLEKVNLLIMRDSKTRKWLSDLSKKLDHEGKSLDLTPELMDETEEICNWFQDYFKEDSNAYKHTSGIRTQMGKLLSHKDVRRVLNPKLELGQKNELDFSRHFEEGGVMAISTAYGELQELGSYLGYFLIFQLQSATFQRPGNENTRKPHFLYIDEFQQYATPGYKEMLTMGRSYRVASILATQNLEQISTSAAGEAFLETLKSNARHSIIFPGVGISDAKYFSEQFGEIKKMKESRVEKTMPVDPITGVLKETSKTEVKKEEVTSMVFSPSDIMAQDMPPNIITYQIIKKMKTLTAKKGIVGFIPSDLYEHMNKIIEKMIIDKEEKTKLLDKYSMLSLEAREHLTFNQFLKDQGFKDSFEEEGKRTLTHKPEMSKTEAEDWIQDDIFDNDETKDSVIYITEEMMDEARDSLESEENRDYEEFDESENEEILERNEKEDSKKQPEAAEVPPAVMNDIGIDIDVEDEDDIDF